MRERLTGDVEKFDGWRAQHREAVAQELTAGSFTDWVEDQLTQAAVGWLLTSVFVRFCEDNLLLGETGVWITHADPRLRQRALDEENAFYQGDPDRSYREWLEVAFSALRANRATAPLVDEHAAIGIISPSSDAVHQLLSFWRRTDDDGNLLWRFNDDELSTRFLGDLYQDLSEYAKKKYALLQTPVFVEEFILEQTLIPALKERPLEGFKVIDPTCGSGHFLLGAFEILVDRWHREAPGMEVRVRVNKALESVYGVDVNPFATAIAMFRLIVAALKQTGDRSLVNAPAFTLSLASGDSLLHGPDALGRTSFDYGDESFDKDAVASRFSYRTEDVPKLRKILTPGQYDVVVGNPPYITVKDKALNARYREIYHYCKGTYALTVPFMERFFQLAKPGEKAGWVGQITSNSFMKRDFGRPLIQEFFPEVDLATVVDSEGAWIPGHNTDGTPTVIIVGRNRKPSKDSVRCVLTMGKRETPEEGAVLGSGPYWSSIIAHLNDAGFINEWISVVDLPRDTLKRHPWSLSGGGAKQLMAAIEKAQSGVVSDYAESVGYGAVTREDAAYLVGEVALRHFGINVQQRRPMVTGDNVRDWATQETILSLWPYSPSDLTSFSDNRINSMLWPYSKILRSRVAYGQTQIERGLNWYEYSMFFANRFRSPLCLTFAFIASHNHFVLDRGGKVFKQSSPIIKLGDSATEDDYMRIAGTLNSSTAAFWLRENTQPKGGAAEHSWARTREYSAAVIERFPLPPGTALERAKHIDELASQLDLVEPSSIRRMTDVSFSTFGAHQLRYLELRAQMIAEQEELDWEVYRNYGLIEEALFLQVGEAPKIVLGERAFEIALARRVKAGELETAWFVQHGSAPIAEPPSHWPRDYRNLVERRLAVIEANPFINLLERPEYKRRWAGEPWESKLQRALRDWLLDKLEDQALWFTAKGTPQPLSVGELAGHVEKDSEFITALDLWAGQKDAPVTPALEKLLADQVVPYLAAMRYKDSGLRKRAEWEHVWSLQRDEDAGLIKASDIPVPPKYTSADFAKQSYWSHRGKLDVPKERFIVYPDAGRATDPTSLLGWAGWNHAQQGIALATIYAQREADGTAMSELVPLVAGIAELLPWVKQWHSEIDPVFNIDLAEYLTAQLAEKSAAVGVPINDLPNWRPPTTTRRKKK